MNDESNDSDYDDARATGLAGVAWAALLLYLISILAGALPARAGTRACTTALVTAGLCRSTSDVLYTLSISTVDPDGAGPLLAPSMLIQNALTGLYGYVTPMTCTADLVAVGVCAAGQLGTTVAITKAQFVDAKIRAWLVHEIVGRWSLQTAHEAATASTLAAADPDIGN